MEASSAVDAPAWNARRAAKATSKVDGVVDVHAAFGQRLLEAEEVAINHLQGVVLGDGDGGGEQFNPFLVRLGGDARLREDVAPGPALARSGSSRRENGGPRTLRSARPSRKQPLPRPRVVAGAGGS